MAWGILQTGCFEKQGWRLIRFTQRLLVLILFFSGQTPGQIITRSGSRRGNPNVPATRKVASPNGKFTLVLDQPKDASMQRWWETEIIASVLASSQAAPRWTLNIKSWPLGFVGEDDIYMSDQGDYFLITDENGRALSLYKQDGKLSFSLPRWVQGGLFRSTSEIFIRVGIFNGERIFGYWDRDENRWIAHKINDGAVITTPDEVSNRWNDEMRELILEKLEKARRSVMVRKLGKLPESIVKLTGTTPLKPYASGVRESHMEFLTQLRNPADRQWLEFFLHSQTDEYAGAFSIFAPQDIANQCTIVNDDRFLADRFLAIWDKKLTKRLVSDQFLFGARMEPFYFLGKISGLIHLSTPFNVFKGPPIRLKLVPQGSSNSDENVVFTGNYRSPTTEPFPVQVIPFTFQTVLPGTYRLKVIWDKRRPLTDSERAGPGDYESDLSAPIVVTAGGHVTNLVIQCTNRVAGGEAYYAADELRLKQSNRSR